MKKTYSISIVLLCLAVLLPSGTAVAAALTMVRDRISNSAASVAADHTIEFTATNAVLPSGSIVITPEAGAFTIPPALDVTDVDMALSTDAGENYTERTLASAASASQDGVAVSSSAITITLNSSTGIAAGERVRVKIGTHTTVDATGDEAIENPVDEQSYRIHIATRDQSATTIDSATTMIAIIAPIAVRTYPPPIPPVRLNGLPSGEIAAGNAVIEISLNTHEIATCRYATTTNVLYEDMLGTFANVGGLVHYRVISGHQDSTAYLYNVRCEDQSGLENEDDYLIEFELKDPADTETSEEDEGSEGTSGITNGPGGPGTSNSSGSGGIGTVPGGSPVLYLASVELSGRSSPLSTVSVLKDGTKVTTVQAGIDGTFETTVNSLERGTYTFVIYSEDAQGVASAALSSVMTLGQGTKNTLSNLLIAPTIAVENDVVDVGEDVILSGNTYPGYEVEVYVRDQDGGSLGDAKRYTTQSALGGGGGAAAGFWELTVDGSELTRGTYDIRARTVIATSTQTKSGYSKMLFVGVGEEPSPDLSIRADINGDGKVNLTDFSIMLTFWNSSNDAADINADGIINLADFSILLFNWTG